VHERAAFLIVAKATSGSRTPGNFAEDRLYHARACLGLRNDKRRFAAKFGERPAKPAMGLFLVSEGLLGQRLYAYEADGSIRFIDRQRLLFVCAMTAGPLWDHESLDFPLADARLTQSPKYGHGKSVADGESEICLRTHIRAEHALATKLAGNLFDDGN
jgi:hypothetical protein